MKLPRLGRARLLAGAWLPLVRIHELEEDLRKEEGPGHPEALAQAANACCEV